MSSTPIPRRCPRCDGLVPAEAPAGLCPRCLLEKAAAPTDPDSTSIAPDALPPRSAPSLESVAAAFPQLEILGLVGQGGMGVVYKARQISLDRLVALKLLAPHRSHEAAFADRFAQEARALAALDHPHIVTVHDFGQSGGFYYLLMEFVDGVNLRELMKTRRLSPEEALAVVPSLCDALQFAHDRGIVHRDIKPENLLLDRTGRAKIADFGIARMLGVEAPSPPTSSPETRAAGTPGYMAPEQKASPRTADNRADIYSLGVVLYEMLTGELPGERLQPPSRKVEIDVRLDAIVLRALERTPERRYQTADELRTQLETVVDAAQESARSSQPPDLGAQTTGAPPASSPVERQGLPGRAKGKRLATILALSLPLAGLLYLALRNSSEAFPRSLFAAAIFAGTFGGLLVGRMFLRRDTFAWSTNPARLATALVVVLLGLGLGAFRTGALHARHAERSASMAEQAMASERELEAARAAELRSRVALEPLEHLVAGTDAATNTARQDPEFVRRSWDVITAAGRVRGLEAIARAQNRRLAEIGIRSPSRSFRAWIPALPLFFAAILVAIARVRRGSTPASPPEHRLPRRGEFGIVAAALVLAFLGSQLVDRHYAREPDAFEAFFLPPPHPPITQLGFTPAGVSNQFVFLDVVAVVEKWSAEIRWEFVGPHLPEAVEAYLADSMEPKPPGLQLRPHLASGNATWTLLRPGTNTLRAAFVLPNAALAEEVHHSLPRGSPGPIRPEQLADFPLFHRIWPGGMEYRARFGIEGVFHSDRPEWVAYSRMGSWNENALRFRWLAQTRRPVRYTLDHGGALETHALHDLRNRLPETEIVVELERIGTNRVRLTQLVGGARRGTEKEGNYRQIAAEILRTAAEGRVRRGEAFELCRIEGVPLRITAGEIPAESQPPPRSAVIVNGISRPLFGLLALVFVILSGTVVAGLAGMLLRRHRKEPNGRGWGAWPTLVIVGLAGVMLLTLLLVVGLFVLS